MTSQQFNLMEGTGAPKVQEHVAMFRFCAELKDFLPSKKGEPERLHGLTGEPLVKDVIEAQGLPPMRHATKVAEGVLSVYFLGRVTESLTTVRFSSLPA